VASETARVTEGRKEVSDNIVLEHLRAIRAELRELRLEQQEQRVRIAAIERSLVDLLRSYSVTRGEDAGLRAEFGGRFDRVLDRLEGIDQRLNGSTLE
jgi:hypothetical protein